MVHRLIPCAALWALAPAATICPCALLPSCLPTLRGGRAQLKIHLLRPPFLPVCFLPSWLCLSAWLPNKTKVTCHALPIYTHTNMHTNTHTRVCLAGALLINFDRISIPMDRGAATCKHAEVNGAGKNVQLGEGERGFPFLQHRGGCSTAQLLIRQGKSHTWRTQHSPPAGRALIWVHT